jgi:hypothetical protein
MFIYERRDSEYYTMSEHESFLAHTSTLSFFFAFLALYSVLSGMVVSISFRLLLFLSRLLPDGKHDV